MKKFTENLKNIGPESTVFLAITILCSMLLSAFLHFYFYSYTHPYMVDEVIDLSANWHYSVNGSEKKILNSLKSGSHLEGGEKLTMYKILPAGMKDAVIMIRANHQTVNIRLDGIPLYTDEETGKNPGMVLRYISLPEEYAGKTLSVDVTSPYTIYSGRTSPVLMGTMKSLDTYTLSYSMRSVIFMAMCLLLGLCIIAFTLFQALHGAILWQNLFLGIFAVIWALYYVCTEYIVFRFFTPAMVSVLSLGFYFTFAVPLTLYFYFSFSHYKKLMLPAVILHGGFAISAISLQFFGVVELPGLVNVNNLFLAGLLYTIILSVLEAVKGNKAMWLSAPFLMIAYISMLYNFNVFYSRHGVVPYTYRDTYLLLILSVLIRDIQQFFSLHYRKLREGEALALQNHMARESYEQIKSYLKQMGGLKHEVKNHLAALQTYLLSERYDEAKNYLDKYVKKADFVSEPIYHEHFLINAVAGNFLRIAKEYGIETDFELRALTNTIAEPDIYSLLTNIMENAIEACLAVSEGKRFIRLAMIRRAPYLTIICENSRTGEILCNGEIKTTKKEEGHGYGLWTIEKIASAYHGFVDMDFDETTFRITVALKD